MNCIQQQSGKNWQLYHGDSCQVIKGIPDATIDFCIHSPPFSSLYTYSDSEADMGNCSSDEEFLIHYSYLIKELHRVTVPGRLCAVHCKDLPKYLNRDGEAGLIDFPGMIIQEFEDAGWTYHSHVTIWKCPVTERERTNNHGLLHKTVMKDSSGIRQGMADYLLVFRKPSGTMLSEKPIERLRGFTRFIGQEQYHPLVSSWHPSPYARTDMRGLSFDKPPTDGRQISDEEAREQSIIIWRRYAEPVWWDIDQMDTLNFKIARDDKDERHLCPLQLGVIERSIELWTLPGEVVLTPFAGVGSELVGALRLGRKAVGIELKEAYWKHGAKNCRIAEAEADRPTLFDVDGGADYLGDRGESVIAGKPESDGRKKIMFADI